MSLQIGFSNKFFTLWNVDLENRYTGSQEYGYNCYQVCHYHYIQNLSFDKELAIKKAKEMGCTNLEVNEELYGRNSSFNYTKKLSEELPNTINPYFTFGKYSNTTILECTDINYLFWYFNKTDNRYSKSILLKNGYVEFNGELMTIEQKEKILRKETVINILSETNEIEVECNSNLKVNDRFAEGLFEFMDVKFWFRFDDYKLMYYQGFEYGLPIIDGKAKRIKNKKLKLSIEPIQEDFNIYFKVNKVQIIKS